MRWPAGGLVVFCLCLVPPKSSCSTTGLLPGPEQCLAMCVCAIRMPSSLGRLDFVPMHVQPLSIRALSNMWPPLRKCVCPPRTCTCLDAGVCETVCLRLCGEARGTSDGRKRGGQESSADGRGGNESSLHPKPAVSVCVRAISRSTPRPSGLSVHVPNCKVCRLRCARRHMRSSEASRRARKRPAVPGPTPPCPGLKVRAGRARTRRTSRWRSNSPPPHPGRAAATGC